MKIKLKPKKANKNVLCFYTASKVVMSYSLYFRYKMKVNCSFIYQNLKNENHKMSTTMVVKCYYLLYHHKLTNKNQKICTTIVVECCYLYYFTKQVLPAQKKNISMGENLFKCRFMCEHFRKTKILDFRRAPRFILLLISPF